MFTIKKIAALGLAATMTMAMGLTAFADSNYPNITKYSNNYNEVVAASGSASFKVCAVSSDWMSTRLFTEDEATSVGWSVVPGSVSGVSVTGAAFDEEQDGEYTYSSKGDVTVAANAETGVAVVEATKGTSSMDFTVAVNPSSPAADVNVNLRIYANGTKLVDTSGAVNYNNVPSDVKYPSAMDAVLMAGGATAIETQEYGNSLQLKGATVNGTTYTNDNDTYKYWGYCVYDASGNKVDITDIAGAEVYDIDAGSTVVWNYGTWYTFPDTLAEVNP